MLDLEDKPAVDFPDDPLKWEGWANYKADSAYERLCLDPETKPTDGANPAALRRAAAVVAEEAPTQEPAE